MADVFTPQKRSEVMSRIRGRDTKPELALRSMLHRLGYRFTVNGPKNRSLPGKPDIVLPTSQGLEAAPSGVCELANAVACSEKSIPGSRSLIKARAS